VQADPLDTAMSLIAINRLSPSTQAKEIFKLPGYRVCSSPLRTMLVTS
jgi:hypothetical protein